MIIRNATASVGQVVISAIIMFILYRTILQILGPERLGIWSVVLATVSASRISELGFGAGVTRFVALYQARGQQARAVDAVQTALVSVGLFFMLAAVPVYYLLLIAFEIIFPSDAIGQASILLPYTMVSLVLTSIAGVIQSGLDGCQRYDRRATLVLAGQLFFLLGALVLTPTYGLLGLALAQIGQGFFLMFAGWFVLGRTMMALPWVPWRWKKDLFLEMLGYGIQIQVGSLATMFFEPLTKILMGKFGGLAAAGYYEMASQFVLKVRSLMVSANQILVPVASALHEQDKEKLKEIYCLNLRLLLFVSVPCSSVIVAWSPLLSNIWIGHYEQQFILFVVIMAVAWGINIMNVPAYFINRGAGRVFWNTASHVLTGVINIGLGALLGIGFGAAGVASGAALALILGSLLVIYDFHREQHVPWRLLLFRESYLLIISSMSVGLLGLICYHVLSGFGSLTQYGVCLLLPAVILLPIVWFHPINKYLYDILLLKKTKAK